MSIPVVDIVTCTLCMGCVEVCPRVFRLNGDTGYIVVADLKVYPRNEVHEAIKFCPEDCITWEE